MARINLALRCDCGGEFFMVFQVNNVAASDYLAEEGKREHCCPHCCKRQLLDEFERDSGSGFRRQ